VYTSSGLDGPDDDYEAIFMSTYGWDFKVRCPDCNQVIMEYTRRDADKVLYGGCKACRTLQALRAYRLLKDARLLEGDE
jgi:hypothetical protein